MSSMLRSRFLQSLNPTPHKETVQYDGYLAFLPYMGYSFGVADKFSDEEEPSEKDTILLQHRILQNQDFCWLELKDRICKQEIELHLNKGNGHLWMLLTILGDGKIELSTPQYLKTQKLLCYYTTEGAQTLSLEEGKAWIFMLGIAQQHLANLVQDYPKLGSLIQSVDQLNDQQVIGNMMVSSKILAVLEALRRFDFKPFAINFQLAAWNLRLCQLVFQELTNEKKDAKDYDMILYRDALVYIREHFWDSDLNPDKIAEAMHVSRRKLFRTFVNKPLTVNGYIIEYRLASARETLLNSDDTLASISFSLNFSCAKHFSRLFKKRFGMGPNEFREKMGKQKSFVKHWFD